MNEYDGMYDVTSWLEFDRNMEDHRESQDDMLSLYLIMSANRRKLELEDVIMKEKTIRSWSNFNQMV